METVTPTSPTETGSQGLENIVPNILIIKENIKNAIEKRSDELKASCPPETQLVAVSKTKSLTHIITAYKGGQRHFGENYVQELVAKAQDLGTDYPDIKWHFIGHLQSNKVSKLLTIGSSLHLIETVDSKNLAQTLNTNQAKRIQSSPEVNQRLGVMVQVNTSGEDVKSGIAPDECEDLVNFILKECSALRFHGLMTIGADYEDLKEPNPDFLRLLKVRNELCQNLDLKTQDVELSMGMSSNYEEAVELGSSNVRVGSTIFGPRIYK